MLLNKDIGDARMLAKKDRTDYEDKKLIQYYYELFYNTKRPPIDKIDLKRPLIKKVLKQAEKHFRDES